MNRRRSRGTIGSSRIAAVMVLSGLVVPVAGHAQIADLLEAANNGGSWINLDIVQGRGSYRSLAVPMAGLALEGCFQVWEGHSGSWSVHARDALGDGELEVTAEPGEPVEFQYKAGMQAQLDVEIVWSEPRDTTLFMWVGLSALAQDRDVCQPPAE